MLGAKTLSIVGGCILLFAAALGWMATRPSLAPQVEPTSFPAPARSRPDVQRVHPDAAPASVEGRTPAPRPLAPSSLGVEGLNDPAAVEQALETWARADLAAARQWASEQRILDSTRALAAIFRGIATDADLAVAFADELSAVDPERTGEYGSLLLSGLTQAGNFERAVAYADSGPDVARHDWLTIVFSAWAAQQPEHAVLRALELEDPSRAIIGFQAAVSTWSKHAPDQLAECAASLPTGPERTFALVAAIRAWLRQSPQAARAWLAARPDVAPILAEAPHAMAD